MTITKTKFENSKYKSSFPRIIEKETQIENLELTNLFWDCECKENYIHPVTESQCNICHEFEEDQRNSLVSEVLEKYPELNFENQIMNVLETEFQ